MSDYSDYILNLGAELLLPLEEDVAVTAIVNIGSLSATSVGVHTDTTNRQANMVYQELFSIRYLDISVSDVTMVATHAFGSLAGWCKLDSGSDVLLTLDNTLVASSLVKFYVENTEIKISSSNGIVESGVILEIGIATHIGFTRDGNYIHIYVNGVLKASVLVFLITEVFDKLGISEIYTIPVENLITETGDTFVGTDLLPLTIEIV